MFKNFDEFNTLTNQLPIVSSQTVPCVTAKRQVVAEALKHAGEAAQRYASSYAKVAVWDYSQGGVPRDVTPESRLSVPDNILSEARAKLQNAKNALKQEVLFSPTWDESHQLREDNNLYVTSSFGSAVLIFPYRELTTLVFQKPLSALQRLIDTFQYYTIDTELKKATMTVTPEVAVDLIADRTMIPVTFVYDPSDASKRLALGYVQVASKAQGSSASMDLFIAITDTGEVHAYLGLQDALVGARMEYPAGEDYLQTSTKLIEMPDPTPGVHNWNMADIVTAIGKDVIDDDVNQYEYTRGYDVVIGEAISENTVFKGFLGNRVSVPNEYVAMTVAQPSQIQGIIDSIA